MSDARATPHRLARIAVVVAAGAALIALATVDFEHALTVISRALGRRGSAAISQRLAPERLTAIRWGLVLSAAALSTFLWFRPGALSAAPRAAARAARVGIRDAVAWFAALPRVERWTWAAVAAMVSAQRFTDALIVPMHCDELRTYFEIVSRGPVVALTAYRDSNNHILHSLLSSVAVASPVPAPLDLRLVSVLASALVPLALAMTLRAAVGALPALVGTAALLVLPPVAFYGASARGYALCLLAATLGMMATTRLVQRPDAARARWVFVLSCGLGALSVPLHVYCVACLVVVRAGFAIADRNARTLARTALDGALSGVVAAIGYAGALLWSDLAALTTARYVRPGAVETLAVKLPGYVGRMGVWMLGADVARVTVPVLVIASAVLLGRTPRPERRQRCLAAIALAFAASVAVIPLVQRMYPPHRGWIHVCLSVSACVALVVARWMGPRAIRPSAAGLIVLLVLAGGVRSTLRSMERNRFDGGLARVDSWLVANSIPDVYVASRLAGLSLAYRTKDRENAYALEVADTWHKPKYAFRRFELIARPTAVVSELAVPPPTEIAPAYRLAHEVGGFGIWVRQP